MGKRKTLRKRFAIDLRSAVAWVRGPRNVSEQVWKEIFINCHIQAISMLNEAEQYLCRDRVACLIENACNLKQEALPENFFQRLALLQGKLQKKGNKGPRNINRDEKIRCEFEILRDEPAVGVGPRLNYEQALKWLGDEFCLDPSSVEKIIGKSRLYDQVGSERWEVDFRRLKEIVMRWDSPKNN
jgi:hypothetical protein